VLLLVGRPPERAQVISMSDGKPVPEPSMEEILASIRRILAEDAHSARPLPGRARAPADVLDLTEAIGEDGAVRHIEPVALRAAAAPAPARLPDGRVEPEPPFRPSAGDRLVSGPASDAVAASLARLATLPGEAGPGNDRALDELVRETLRPLLQAWLDEHLPELVERLVQAEIVRMVGDAPKR
jgi:cell pole-organizing protein PopZ